jgi:hypothetical protein
MFPKRPAWRWFLTLTHELDGCPPKTGPRIVSGSESADAGRRLGTLVLSDLKDVPRDRLLAQRLTER